MGDRADIILYREWDRTRDVIVYHTHWLASEFHNIFKDYVSFAKLLAKDQTHWLTYPEDLGAYLSFIDGLTKYTLYKGIPIKPDIYPRGNLRDTDGYSWIVVLPKSDKNLTYKLYKIEVGYEGIPDEVINTLKNEGIEKALQKVKVVKEYTITI